MHPVAVALAIAAALSWPALSGDERTAELLHGPDDFMRLVQVLDWLDGQGWRDTRQRRLDPPDGGAMHWSRIADLPLGVTVALLTPIGGREWAIRTAVIAVPALLGGALIALLFWIATPLVPARERAIAALLTLPALCVPLAATLRPGRVDHHGLQLVLVALAAGLVFRSLHAGGGRLAAAAGVVAAISLVVGLETLPFVATTGFVLLLAAIVRADAAPSMAAFGGALAATAPALLFLTASPQDWATAACDRMSFPHLTAAAACAAVGGIAVALRNARPTSACPPPAHRHAQDAASAAASLAVSELASGRGLDRGWGLRLGVIGGAALAAAGVVVALFPQCVGSPYAELAPEAQHFLGLVSEARSLPQYFADRPGTATALAALPWLAMSVAAARLRRGGWTAPDRLAAFALALSGVAVGWWQIRGLPYAALVAAIALLPLTAALTARLERVPRPATRLALRLCVPIAYIATTMLPIIVQVIVRPPGEDARPSCELDDILHTLQDRRGHGGGALTIAAPIGAGPEILLRTPHAVLAAPYHRNVRGFADIRRIFAGTEAEVRATAAERSLDAIVFCSRHADTLAYPDRQGFLGQRLRDAHPPNWLAPVAGDGVATQLYMVELHHASASSAIGHGDDSPLGNGTGAPGP